MDVIAFFMFDIKIGMGGCIMNKKVYYRPSKRRNIVLASVIILMGLLILDVIFKGQVYQRLPNRWQNRLLEWAARKDS